jgi:hypothetical protein
MTLLLAGVAARRKVPRPRCASNWNGRRPEKYVEELEI